MNFKFKELEVELIRLKPVLLYDIARDIQVSKKWREFAWLIGFSNDNVTLIEQLNNSDRFPAENIMYHWYSKNPKLIDLVDVLIELKMEKSLERIKNENLLKNSWTKISEKLASKKAEFYGIKTPIEHHKPINNNSNNKDNCTTEPSAPPDISTEPTVGMIDVDVHMPSIPRAINNFKRTCSKTDPYDSEYYNDSCPCLSHILSLLELSSLKFDVADFQDDLMVDLKSDNTTSSESNYVAREFVIKFYKKIRYIEFEVHAYSIDKIISEPKYQKHLYNIIWVETTFRFNKLPILSGYCIFQQNYLLLFYSTNHINVNDDDAIMCADDYSLYSLLHVFNHQSSDNQINADDRLIILHSVAQAIAFLHRAMPFAGCHNQIYSSNIQVTNNNVVLRGFEKFYTEHPNYLIGLKTINNFQPKSIEKHFRQDIHQFLDLICEVWFNVQSTKGKNNGISLTKMVREKKLKPKIMYDGWTELNNKAIYDLISKADDKLLNIVEIMEDLQNIRVQQNFVSVLPPSYDEIQMSFTNKFTINE